jgi:hypothetical protein
LGLFWSTETELFCFKDFFTISTIKQKFILEIAKSFGEQEDEVAAF